MTVPSDVTAKAGSPGEVFWAFLKLGLTAFGGPAAHWGYFRTEFVDHRRWVSDEQFGQLLAISQFLPGPGSSQLGFSLGLLRAGWLGALAAFVAFTLPSVLLLVAFAVALPWFSSTTGAAVIHGLKLVACAVVADAVLGMFQKLCTDTRTRMIALLSAGLLLLTSSVSVQPLVVVLAAAAGVWLLRDRTAAVVQSGLQMVYGRRLGSVLLLLFVVLLLGLPLLTTTGEPDVVSVAEAFYRTGALVFGGGHVVLPLLQDALVATGWVTSAEFLAGYGAAQAIPGPMFSFSAYLGVVLSSGDDAMLMAATALLFIFLPGFLLIAGVLPFWKVVSRNPAAGGAIAGVNAAVVGILAAALYDPIFTTGIASVFDVLVVAIGLGLLMRWRMSPLVVVVWCVLASVLYVWG